MSTFDAPLSKFRDIIREKGNDRFGFEIDGELFNIGTIYGETDLIPCVKNCPLNGGFYADVLPSEEFKGYIQIMYQCSYCDTVIIKNYNNKTMEQYSDNEFIFIKTLIEFVLTKQIHDVANYGKRRKVDIFKENLPKYEDEFHKK